MLATCCATRVAAKELNWWCCMQVASPLGVPAGPLLDSKWTTLAANLGYDIVTYKTIRTCASTGHAPPNVLYLQADGKQLPAAGDTTPLQVGAASSGAWLEQYHAAVFKTCTPMISPACKERSQISSTSSPCT
jgi:hypothetical protein